MCVLIEAIIGTNNEDDASFNSNDIDIFALMSRFISVNIQYYMKQQLLYY